MSQTLVKYSFLNRWFFYGSWVGILSWQVFVSVCIANLYFPVCGSPFPFLSGQKIGRDVPFFLKILFIYLTEIETAAREGIQAGGVGEEEAGSQQRSLMWGSIPQHGDHVLGRRQTFNHCAMQMPRDVPFLRGVWEGEAGFLPSRKPNAGLCLRTLGTWPEPKADASQLSHAGTPHWILLSG